MQVEKVTQDNQDMSLVILTWHNTHTERENYSPVEKLQSRRTHTQLPTTSEWLHPEIPNGIDGGNPKKKTEGQTTT